MNNFINELEELEDIEINTKGELAYDELEITLALVENGYKLEAYTQVMNKAALLGYSKKEIMNKINKG